MRFPYAYYRTYFDGQIHGESFKGQMLVLEPEDKAGGDIDVAVHSNIVMDSSLGDIIIDGFQNGDLGQILFIRNKASSNKIVLKNSGIGTQQITSFINKDIYIEANQSAVLIASDFTGTTKWLMVSHSANSLAMGSQASPALYVAQDRNTGIFSPAADAIGFTTNGLSKLIAHSTYISSLVTHRLSDGTVAAPALAFNSDPDTGFFKKVNSDIGIAMDGVETGFFSTTGIIASLALQTTNGFLLSDNIIQVRNNDAVGPNGMLMGFLGVGTTDYIANYTATPVNGIYAEGNIKTSGIFEGVATSALYADLAERYHSESGVEAGDVVSLGGSREVQKSSELSKDDILGVISTDPAFKMNDKMKDEPDHPFVALTGRTPCKIKGPVIKGQRLIISDEPGVAIGYTGDTKDLSPFEVIGRVMRTDGKSEERKIEIVVGRL